MALFFLKLCRPCLCWLWFERSTHCFHLQTVAHFSIKTQFSQSYRLSLSSHEASLPVNNLMPGICCFMIFFFKRLLFFKYVFLFFLKIFIWFAFASPALQPSVVLLVYYSPDLLGDPPDDQKVTKIMDVCTSKLKIDLFKLAFS